MFAFVFRVAILVLVLGGIIAYLGNYVGRYIGKKRLTIFNLRPRYTAIAITVISGVLIALSTLLILLGVSKDARLALLGLEQLKVEIGKKSEELKVANRTLQDLNRALEKKLKEQKALEEKLRMARTQIVQLESLKERLQQETRLVREGQILFRLGEVIFQSLIQAGPEKEKLESGLKQILSAADAYLRTLGLRGEKHLIYVAPEDFTETLSFLQAKKGVYLVKLVAVRNIMWGEEVAVRFELAENRRLYQKGEEIAQADISSELSLPEIEQEIMKLLRLAHENARLAGVSPDPSGRIGSIPYAQIFEIARKIKTANRLVNLKILAEKDIYTVGPLEVRFKVSYK